MGALVQPHPTAQTDWGVFSKSGMSLETAGIGGAQRVDLFWMQASVLAA
jgi:hypothetical protein